MRRTLRTVLLVISSFVFLISLPWLSTSARAELKVLPMWEAKQCGGKQFACYNFEVTKSLLNLDLTLHLQLEERRVCLEDLLDTKKIISKLHEIEAVSEKTIQSQTRRLFEKDIVLRDTTEKLKKMESNSIWTYLPWVVTSTVVLMAGSFIAGWYLHKQD